MEIAIAGAGAMGCRFGFMFHEAGNQVLLIDNWKEHVETIQHKGLVVVDEKGSRQLNIAASLPAESHGLFDLLIIFTKSMQSEEMIKSCRHLVNEDTYVLTLQNGIGNLETLQQFFANSQLLSGVTTFATELLGPGEIQALGSGDTRIMQVNAKEISTLNHIVDIMNQSGMHTKISQDVYKSIWEKVAFNCVLNPLCTLMNHSVATVGKYEKIQDVMKGIVDEVILVAQAEGIYINRKSILSMIEGAFSPSLSGRHLTCMLQDVMNGRASEIDYLKGAIMRKGEKHGIAVTYNELITHLIKMLESVKINQELIE